MSSLTTNNITINKITSSNGKFSGDNASGRIELRLSNAILYPTLIIPWKFDIGEGGFVNIKFKTPGGNIYEEEYIYESVDNYKYTSTYGIQSIIISGSKINGIYNKTETAIVPPDSNEYNLNELEITLNSFQFPKDSPDLIDCENIFANWNLQGELPELDDRISNLNGAFANTQLVGKLPKLPKNLKYASNAFLNCSSLTGVSKDLLTQHVTAQKPYIKFENSTGMVSGCPKSVTSWFSVDNGGDHDNIEYTEWTSSRNTAASFPYISLTLPRALKDNYNCRVIYKNFERYSGFTSTVFCSRDVRGKNTSIFCNTPSEAFRFDTNSAQTTIQLDANKIKNLRPCDFTIVEKGNGKLKLTLFNALESEEFERTITETSSQLSTKIATLFASQVNGNAASNQGKLAIAELDIWDDQGYLIKMRSQGTSMVDLVSGTTYSSASATPFVTLPVEIRDIDKEDLLFWEKFSGKTLPLNFWDEYSIALADYKANPTKTEEWTVQFDKTTVTSSSNSPYFTSAPTKPLVNFFLTKCTGVYPGYYNGYPGPHQVPISPFAKGTNQIMYFPNLTSNYCMVAEQTNWQVFPICPKGNSVQSYKTKIPQYVWYKNVTGTGNLFSSGYATEVYFLAPNVSNVSKTFTYGSGSQAYLKKVDFTLGKVTTMNNGMNINYSPVELLVMRGDFDSCTNLVKFMIAVSASAKTTQIKFVLNDDYQNDPEFKGATLIDQFAQDRSGWTQSLIIPSCSSATNAFLNTGMSSRNIAKTLNSLPKWTDGKAHTITFTGCPGIEWEETTETFNGVANCPKFTKDTEGKALRKAFAKAVTNGWTVEIGTAIKAASTMSLRKLQYYKKTESEYGDYIDSEGKTYIISVGDAFGPEGKNQGYEQFSCLEECLESWNLTEIPREEPVPFEEFIEEEQLEELE